MAHGITPVIAFWLLVAATGCKSAEGVSAAPVSSATQGAPAMDPHAMAPSPAVPSAATSALTLIEDPSLVCMVNNQFMGRPQIPVEVEGRTYYGCCEMCKGRLANDPSSRTAVDPASGRSVDKASAVVAKTENGSTLYFENRETFAAYRSGSRAN
jgi:YHS domain-containing protein